MSVALSRLGGQPRDYDGWARLTGDDTWSWDNVLPAFHGKARIALEYLFKRTGPMSMAPSQLGAFTRSSTEHVWPNLEYHVQPLSLDAFGALAKFSPQECKPCSTAA